MINTLYLPELREALAEKNIAELQEFCTALHPARTAEFMEGLEPAESWEVLRHTDVANRAQIFSYIDHDKQVEIIESQDRDEVADLIAELAPDDRVDLLDDVEDAVVDDLLPRVPADERRDILRLSQYPEDTAGAIMTSEVATLSESMTVKEALDELSREGHEFETIYYLYIVDENEHLRGLVSARQLVTAMRRPDTKLGDIMETDLVHVEALDDQEEVAQKVAKYDLLAIPVVDGEHRMLGIITHDDVIDVFHEEAIEDAHRAGAVDPLEESYLKTHLFTLSWKRGMWLTILFFCALLTAMALQHYDESLAQWVWLVPFIPLIISSGGNSGSQSATLIITALSRGHIHLSDWLRVVLRESVMGLLLGSFLALLGFVAAGLIGPGWREALVIPVTLLLVVLCGTMTGAVLPLIFERMGFDPALMSNPFVAGIVDILGIVIYMNVAFALLD
jgi:magnesium transporter